MTPFLKGFGILDVADVGDNLILDFHSSPEDGENFDEWVEGSGWLSGMASLRSDILSGDWRALYLACLWTVDQGDLRNEVKESLPGIGLLNAGLKTFADFFRIDSNFVSAAAEESAVFSGAMSSHSTTNAAIANIPDDEKLNLLCRLAEGDPHVVLDVRKQVNKFTSATSTPTNKRLRTATDLRARAERQIAEKKRRAAEREQQRIAAEKACRRHLDTDLSKGESAWKQIFCIPAKTNTHPLKATKSPAMLKFCTQSIRFLGKSLVTYQRIHTQNATNESVILIAWLAVFGSATSGF